MSWRAAFVEHFGPGGFSGASLSDWFNALRRVGFAIDPRFWPRAALISANCAVNSLARVWERLRYDAAICKTVVAPPLFILGVWRSGTTHLHNLLARDHRFAFCNTYEAFYPHTFLSTQGVGGRFMQWMSPSTRPMDNVKSGVDEPQEDEFALVVSGLSFMLGLVVFPRARAHYQQFLTLLEASPAEVRAWKQTLLYFLQKLTLKYQRPLVLKSPAHTGRIKFLLELFPDAKFVHIHRHPYEVFQSTVHTWQKVAAFWCLQTGGISEQRVLDDYVEVYDAFFAQRGHIPSGNYCDVRFEELERDPLGQLEQVYTALRLPDFGHAEPTLRSYVKSLAGYQRNTFTLLSEPQRARVAQAWRRSFEEWNYAKTTV